MYLSIKDAYDLVFGHQGHKYPKYVGGYLDTINDNSGVYLSFFPY